MNVRMTDVLRQELLEIDDDPDDLIKEFSDWKSRGPQGENDHYYFGKDGEYIRPTVDNERVLRHVHFVPFTDVIALEAWDLAWSRRGRRVSDTALVYVDGGWRGYLLLTILWSPDAHAIADMATPEHRELMENLAAAAEQFRFDGTCDV